MHPDLQWLVSTGLGVALATIGVVWLARRGPVRAARAAAAPRLNLVATTGRAPARQAEQVYRILAVLNIERFSRPELDDRVRVRLRRALWEAVEDTLDGGGIPPRCWEASTTGDGLLVVADPAVATAQVLRALLDRLPASLDEHNRLAVPIAHLRIRVVVHAAHVMLDRHGVAGEQVSLAFRLLDGDPLRAWLAQTATPAAIAVSDDVYQQVVRQRALGLDPEDFQPLQIAVKETRARAWVYTPGDAGAIPAVSPAIRALPRPTRRPSPRTGRGADRLRQARTGRARVTSSGG